MCDTLFNILTFDDGPLTVLTLTEIYSHLLKISTFISENQEKYAPYKELRQKAYLLY